MREVVKMIKNVGENLGLRRRVEKANENKIEQPNIVDMALDTTYIKHSEF